MSLLNLPIHLQLLIFAFLYPNVSYAKAGLMNFTIDDNDPAILYSPGWNVSASQDPLDYGGLHHLSDQSSAFAVFNFTGVGIYFLSPLWPFPVKAQLVLDGKSPPVLLDLQDYSRPVSATGGSESVPSTAVWGVQDLELGSHSLRVEFAQGQAEYVALDALVYSSIAETSASDTMPVPASPSAVSASIAPTRTLVHRATSSSAISTRSPIPIVVGVVIGIVVAVILIVSTILFFRYRARLARRFPRMFPVADEEQPEYRDQSELLPLELGNLPLPIAENFMKSPAASSAAGTLPSARSMTLVTNSTSPLASRPSLPLINTKQLPPIPPDEEVVQSGLRYGRSLISAVRRFTSAPPGTPMNIESATGTSSSATSSFFPKPLYDEDRPLSRQKSLPGRSGRSTPSAGVDVPEMPKMFSRAGTFHAVTERKSEVPEARLFPVRPIAMTESSNPRPVVSVDISGSKSDSHRISTQSPTPLTPSYTKRKPVNALTIIPENIGPRPRSSVHSGVESISSDRTTKRRSEGKIRLDKERQRRRRPKTPPVTPHGPRPRPLPSIAAYSAVSSPLPSASSGGSSDAASGTPTSPGSRRRRRPLPPTLPEIQMPPLLLRSQSASVIQTKSPLTPVMDASNPLEAHSTEASRTEFQLPPLEWTIPTLPPLPSLTPFPAPDAPSTPVALQFLRPRTGQPDHSLSLPSSLPSRDPDTPGNNNTSSRGPLPPTPNSAQSAPDSGNKSPRSPRRLPPKPLQLKNARTGNSLFESRNGEDLEAQYITIPPAPPTAPPPYSGRRIISKPPASSKLPSPMQRLLAREGVHVAESPGEDEKEFSAFSKQSPRSIPVTPSEKSWRSSSAFQSVVSGKRPQGRAQANDQDDTAAEMLFELLRREPGSPSTQASSIIGSSIISGTSTSHRISMPPRPLRAIPRVEGTSADDESLARTLKDESRPVARTPKVSIIPEDEPPSSARTPKLPPSPRSPLVVPPHPTSPPPLPTTPRRKIWSSEGVHYRSSTAFASTPASTLNRKRSGSDSNVIRSQDNRSRDFVPTSYL